MDHAAVYCKSAKGTQAIGSRASGLTGKPRALLILVDGKRSVDELMQLAAGLGEPAQMLRQLETDGYIERVAAAHTGPVQDTPAAQASTAPDTGSEARMLSVVKVLASRRLVEIIGPTAEDICIRIESCKELPQFIEAMKRAYAIVRDVRGQAVADRFGQEIEDHMPRA